MAISSMGYYSGQNEMFMRDESTSNCLAAMLSPCLPQVDLQARRYGGGNLEDDGLVQGVGQKRASFATNDSATVEDGAEDGDEGADEGTASVSHLEKKRRLTLDQVRSLERNFEAENKLEPDRKMQLAKELGLRPRQVAVWFQNRRARWKTKQLERDYETLEADYKRLKADYELMLDEKNHLEAELQRLSGDTLGYKQGDDNQGAESLKIPKRDLDVSNSVDTALAKEETRGSTDGNSSDVVDADSPRTTDSSRISAIQSPDFPPESFMGHPELLRIYSGETLHPDSAVKLEDGFHEDQSCNCLLLHLDHQSGVLPWWD